MRTLLRDACLPTDGGNCRLGSGHFGASPFCWQFSDGQSHQCYHERSIALSSAMMQINGSVVLIELYERGDHVAGVNRNRTASRAPIDNDNCRRWFKTEACLNLLSDSGARAGLAPLVPVPPEHNADAERRRRDQYDNQGRSLDPRRGRNAQRHDDPEQTDLP